LRRNAQRRISRNAILQESLMLSNNSRSLKTRLEAPFGNGDDVIAANRKLVLVPRPDPGVPAIRPIEPEPTNEAHDSSPPLWSVVFTYLMEGFVLYGASVHPGVFPVELFRTGDNVSEPDEMPERAQPRKLRAVVAPSADVAEVATPHRQQASGNTALAVLNAGILESDGVKPAGVVRRSATRCWNLLAGIRADWLREREIKRAVYALAEFDDRTLRDMGIRDRSEIESAVRQGRNPRWD
jgi:uncharacterized protein YjiS (DUF1127 family)